jgi:hypothetical protein
VRTELSLEEQVARLRRKAGRLLDFPGHAGLAEAYGLWLDEAGEWAARRDAAPAVPRYTFHCEATAIRGPCCQYAAPRSLLELASRKRQDEEVYSFIWSIPIAIDMLWGRKATVQNNRTVHAQAPRRREDLRPRGPAEDRPLAFEVVAADAPDGAALHGTLKVIICP